MFTDLEGGERGRKEKEFGMGEVVKPGEVKVSDGGKG